jgi:tetratricopeptide (TPR) repeat protein
MITNRTRNYTREIAVYRYSSCALDVKLLKDIVKLGLLSGRVLLLLAFLLLGACASQSFVSFDPPPPLKDAQEVHIAEVDVLELSPEMEAFLQRYILPYKNKQTRLHLLTTSVTSSGVLGFSYDPGPTLTAAEAFKARSGNCIGFANMMIALARRAGLKANYQEVIRKPQWTSLDETVLLVKHVNVVIEGNKYTYVMDVSDLYISHGAQRRVVSDTYAKALYLNNFGADALLKNNLSVAYAYQVKAIQTNPELTDSWVNMSVVFGRNDQLDDAETVLNRALQIDDSQASAMNNLYEVYVEQGNLEAAGTLQARVDRYRRNNPYYLLLLSYEALEQNQFDQSIDLLQRAIKKKDNDHLLHYALAKTQYLSGEPTAAQTSLMRARELAPQDMLAYYRRPLGELIAEEKAKQDALDP